MEAHLRFVALHALSLKTRAAAGASSSARFSKAATVTAGCPSFGGQRTATAARKQGSSEHHANSSRSSRSKYQACCKCHCPSGDGQAPRRKTNRQAQHRYPSGSLRTQRWHASPSKSKEALRFTERGLTLPSSGPAFGGPLKSNVRRHETASARPLSYTSRTTTTEHHEPHPH